MLKRGGGGGGGSRNRARVKLEVVLDRFARTRMDGTRRRTGGQRRGGLLSLDRWGEHGRRGKRRKGGLRRELEEGSPREGSERL